MAILMVAVAGDAGSGDGHLMVAVTGDAGDGAGHPIWLLLQVMQVVEMAILMVAVEGNAGSGDGHPNGCCCR